MWLELWAKMEVIGNIAGAIVALLLIVLYVVLKILEGIGKY